MSRGFQALFVACILVASTAMFAIAESRKLDRAPIKQLVLSAGPQVKGRPRPAVFSPTCRCATSYARISFRLGKHGPLKAWIVSPAGAVVKQLGDFKNVRRVTLRWNGQTETGSVAPDGSYRLRLKVAGSTRTLPVFVVVDTRPPSFTATLSRRTLVPGGYIRDNNTVVTWRSREQLFGIAIVATSGGKTRTLHVYRHSKAGSIRWPKVADVNGHYRQARVADGSWALKLVAHDQAGNRSAVRLGTVQVETP